MKKLLSFVFWPALAGAVFAGVLMAMPALLQGVPQLAPWLTPASDAQRPAATLSFRDAIRKAAPAVVSINSQQFISRIVETYDLNNPFRVVPRHSIRESNSLGSGVIVSPNGFIITSYHIFSSPGQTTVTDDITVTLNDGRTMKARPLMADREHDLALLKVDGEHLPHISVSQDRLSVGDIVLAIGNPRNIGQSVSLGIISALVRRDDGFVIQTDAAINPGNSGGALIDIHGNMIGINSTIVSASGGSEGIGFATPAVNAMNLLSQYLEAGPGGYLGIDSPILFNLRTGESQVRLGQARVNGQSVSGIPVSGIFSNGPADQAGIRCGDLIVAVDGNPINTQEQARGFLEQVSRGRPDQTLSLRIFRRGEFLTIPVTLGVGVGEPVLEFPFQKSVCPGSTHLD